MLFHVVGLVVGLMLLVAGIFYWMREKEDPVSRKIYITTAVIGAVISAFILCRWILL